MIRLGDRVKVVFANESIKTTRGMIRNGATGTVKDTHRFFYTGIEFDDDIGGNSGNWGGKDGHCWYVDNECLEEIEESEAKEMSEFEVGDRVRIISDPKFIEFTGKNSIIGMTGTVKELDETYVGVEFDIYMGGHSGSWNGKDGHCWDVPYECLEKIEDTGEETAEDTKEETKEEVKEETKIDTLERKILIALREEIGVDIGEEFDVYENGEKQWTCKFEENGFFDETNGKFRETGLWKNIIGKFHKYKFKEKPFVPKYGEDYFFLAVEYDKSKGLNFRTLQSTWIDSSIDDGMLAVGNIFRTEEEALKRRDELLEKLEKLRKGEA